MPIAKISDETSISYVFEQRDEAETVVFVNGSIFNYKQWLPAYLPAFRSLTKDKMSYVLYDYQGIGKSSPKIAQYTLQDLAEELLGLLEFLNLKKVHFFGVSKGTMVSQVFTGFYPDRVLSLAGYGIINLLGPKIGDIGEAFAERREAVLSMDDILSERITKSNFKRLIRTVYTPAIFEKPYSQLKLKEKIFHWIMERKVFPMLESTPIRTLEMLFRYYAEDIEKEVDQYESCIESIGDKPVLLLNGTADRIAPIELARDLEPRLTNAKLIEFDQYDHVGPNLSKKKAKNIMLAYTTFLSQFINFS